MKPPATPQRSRPTAPAVAVLAAAWLLLGRDATAPAQLPTAEEQLKILTDPEDVKKKLEKEKDRTRPPIEMARSQVAPFDVLPYIKARHWSTLSLEARANYDDYVGTLRTAPVAMLDPSGRPLPQEVVYARDARLPKTQRMRLGMQVLLPRIPGAPRAELGLELVRPDAGRPDEVWPAPLRVLEPHQMLVVILSREASASYAPWNRLACLYPPGADRNDPTLIEKVRYYRLVLPLEPERPPLSPHPLTWSTISHVVWDGLPPESLNPSQQEALLDWLHWGGQLVVAGGAGASPAALKDSFLGPFLPADATGETELLGRNALLPLSMAYPPTGAGPLADPDAADADAAVARRPAPSAYAQPVPIDPPPGRPVVVARLVPKEGASRVGLGDGGGPPVAVEWRVGRGRVTMLALNLTDPSLAVWPGLDTFIRRVVLRRPENRPTGFEAFDQRQIIVPPQPPILPGPELSWVRYLTRDMAVGNDPAPADRGAPEAGHDADTIDASEVRTPQAPVASWVDTRGVPRLARDVLEGASGIKIPDAGFVLKVVLAYVLILVPVNWLVCRFLVGRRELAWVAVPLLAVGFAVGVERAAAYDLGYNSACDEVDVIEAFGGYPRAHLTRFSSLFSGGRTRFSVTFPGDPTAVVLPMDVGRALRGEDVTTSSFRSFPVPGLEGFLVQPRSLAMVRAEQMRALDGSVSLVTEGGVRKVVNAGGLELRDAVVVDVGGPRDMGETYLGTIHPGETVEVKAVPVAPVDAGSATALRPQRFLKAFRETFEDRPENRGEIRLVAWTPGPQGGQAVEPAVDRHRGFTAVVVHLRHGPPPAPDGPTYDRSPRNRRRGP